MTIRNATVRQLQIFVEAAQALSFTRVAERLHLTPAAVSFQIKQIEALAGFALFERLGRGMVLTEAGKALVDYATLVLKALNAADQHMGALKGLGGGEISIGLVSTGKYIVPQMLARFQGRHPSTSIHLKDGNRREIIEWLAQGQIDLAIMGQPPDGVEVDAEPFAGHPSVIVAAPSHPLAGGAEVPLKALGRERFISREEGSGTRALMDRLFREAGIAPEIVMTSNSNEMIKQAVMAGMGVALISRHTIGLEIGLNLIAALKVEEMPLARSWFVAHRRNMPLMPLHRALRAFLLERGQAMIDDINRGYGALRLQPSPAGHKI